MKKLLMLSLLIVLVMAVAAFAGLSGTPHQLISGGEICVACHTPHGAVSSSVGPLWNRSQASQTYSPLYNSATFNMGPTATPGAQSLACLTCHNGVASTLVNGSGPGVGNAALYAINAAGTSGGIDNYSYANPFANIGLDLSNDHPIGFLYNAAADLQGNNFPTAVNGVIASVYPLYAGNMECATCHDVHNVANPGRDPVYFLRASNAASALCTACHTTKL